MAVILDWRPALVRATRDLTADIRLFEIEPERFVEPTPGAHVNVSVQIGGRPDTRSYSLVGPCRDGVYRIAVKLLPESRGGSAYMWSLAPGSRLTVSQPGNHFPLALGRPGYTLVAGGIGITPIYTMALALRDAGADFRVAYAARTADDLAFLEELALAVGPRLETFVGDRRIDLHAEIARLAPGGEMYLCGPIGMLEAGKHAWRDSGRPVGGLRFETFGNSGQLATLPFTVEIPRLNKTVDVGRNQTMLDALEAAGIAMIYDCRRGECGLCALPILEARGEVDHRDVFFSDEEKAENTKLCTCVSRIAGGSVVIDTGDRL